MFNACFTYGKPTLHFLLCMSWLISFAWAYLSCNEGKQRKQNEAFFPTAGLVLTNPESQSYYRNH